MSKIEEQSKSSNTSEIRYLSPLDIDTAKVKKYCMFRRSGIKYVDYKALRKRFKDTGMITTRKGKEPFMVFDEPKGEFVDIEERRTKQDPDIKNGKGTEPAKYSSLVPVLTAVRS